MSWIRSFDYSYELDEIGGEILEAVRRVIEGGRLILGPEVERFERDFARHLGGGHGVGVASGTDALTVCLMAKGIGLGDEVITVPNTATATANAIVRAGATPVFCDIDPETGLMDIDAAARAVTPRTRAVVPVHLYGNVVDVPRLAAALSGRGLFILEDCAQAVGARLGERAAGTLGDAAAFSFYPTKNLGAYGDGGFCLTADAALADAIRQVRRYGFAQRDYAVRLGLNSRLDEMQAAILNVKLPHVNRHVDERRALAAVYDAELGVAVKRFRTTTGATHGYHLYVIRCQGRERVAERLRALEIETAVHYPHPIHQMPAFSAAASAVRLPHAEAACSSILSLPLHPGLSPRDVARVSAAVNEVCV